MKRTNADFPLPDKLSYVSEVNENLYTVTTFETNTLAVLYRSVHNDTREVFNFLEQKLINIEHEPHYQETKRVRAHPSDNDKFQIRGDDGWFDVECGFGKRFEPQQQTCVPVSFCDDKPPGNYGLDESTIDSLVLNHRVVKENVNPNVIHPTMYLRCMEGGSHSIIECPTNHLFDAAAGQCVLRNDCQNRPDGFVLSTFPENLNIDEYMVCDNEQAVVAACADGKIFDRRLMTCVDADPCSVHGAGYTYITNDIGPAQYFKCISDTESELITCINRVVVGDRFQCSGDILCSGFANGTGTQIKVHDDDTVRFDTGVLVCDEYNVQRNIDCDTADTMADKVFNGKFKVSLHVPRQIYNASTNSCVDFDAALYNIKSAHVSIESLPNDLHVDFQTAMLGRADRLSLLLHTDRLDGAVEYARDKNAVGLNPVTGLQIECFGDGLYDIFKGTQLNFCANNAPVEKVTLADDQYIRSRTLEVGLEREYQAACSSAMNRTHNFVELDHFSVDIFSHILHNDVCGAILTAIHDKYTTLYGKYTTIDVQYTFESVKPEKYIGEKHTNTFDIPISISKLKSNSVVDMVDTADNDNGGGSVDNERDKSKKFYVVDDSAIAPLFDPFEYIQTIPPLFNIFDNETDDKTPQTLALSNKDSIKLKNVDAPTTAGSTAAATTSTTTEVNSTPPSPPSSPTAPDLIYSHKLLEFSCFYALPTFKFSACNIENEHIQNALINIKNNVTAHPDCTNAVGLSNIINAYAYLGEGIGCKSFFNVDTLRIVVDKIENGPTYLNVETQSNDGVKYNKWVHKLGSVFMACPDILLDNDNFVCNTAQNTLYYIENMQN
ncbi:Per os infectivity factor 8 [Trabala vishnou gigantina nucleopolyhedrovirus]|uniref:Per os infectivity factor 8 n=1 Tax=Trabala vishnou gigantina nucleopolyhedrovirus TaxID=2863583 RepID=UPI0024819B4F|nr:Per os infectivity factor 8 [Trabala vishnou gigantina nucleopolyhedrovirus]QYC92656.1 Per os infectivity factor 8 [Trabala vishnou gigantina nucleopolyhedrovirus]